MRPRLVLPLFASVAILASAGCTKKKDPAPEPSPTSSSVSTKSTGSASSALASASAKPASTDAAVDAPLSYDRKITAADLDGRSLRELALIRNMPFARGGKKFRKPWLTEFFGKQPWYKPTDTFDESKVSKL